MREIIEEFERIRSDVHGRAKFFKHGNHTQKLDILMKIDTLKSERGKIKSFINAFQDTLATKTKEAIKECLDALDSSDKLQVSTP